MLKIQRLSKNWVPAFLWGLFISWATLKPSSHGVLNLPLWLGALHIDKWVHFGLWFVWTFIFLKNVKPTGNFTLVSLVFFSAYGGFIEVLQGEMNLGRTCDIWDWVADTVGVISVPFCIEIFGKQKRPAK